VTATSGERLLVNFFYANPVGHAVEALHYCLGHHLADPTREVSVGEDQYLDARTETDAGRLYSVRCLMGTSRLAVRRSPLARILPFERRVLFEADELLFNVLPALGRVCILSERLTDYRLHGENNYQNAHLSLEKITRYRLVHEALRACMHGIYSKLELVGPYVTLSASAVEEHCERVKRFEEALLSRKQALNVVLGSPHILGFVNPSLAKRLAFALPVLAFGLRPSLLAMARLRRLGPRRGFHSERLL